jgi:uncharacterized membrane protein required for colicin V production
METFLAVLVVFVSGCLGWVTLDLLTVAISKCNSPIVYRIIGFLAGALLANHYIIAVTL